MDPIISVIVPVYNGEKYIARAANSILQQPCSENIELLLIDDGSTDRTGEICDHIANTKNNVQVFHKENGGVSSARNIGIEHTHGKYIAFLDADDWWTENFFDAAILKELACPDSDDIYVFSLRLVNNDQQYEHIIHVTEGEWQRETLNDEKYSPDDHVSPCCFFHKTSHIQANDLRFFPCAMNEDATFLHLSITLSLSVKAIDKVVYNYWENTSSYLHSSSFADRCTEEIKSLRFEQAAFAQRGISMDNDRSIVSLIVDLLPSLCVEYSFHQIKAYLKNEYCKPLFNENIKPWQSLQNSLNQWRANPFLFWLRSQLYPGLPLKLKAFCYRIPFLRMPANHFQHKYIMKWEKIKP